MKKIFKSLLIRNGHRLRVWWWFCWRPITRGAKCLILHKGKVLLVRPAYGHGLWMIPGGGVKRHESCIEGAHRELREETGIETELTHFYTYQQQREYKDDTVQCFFGDVDTPKVQIDNFEIIEYGWFRAGALPHDCSPSVDRIIQAWQSTHT